jgi:hypothetical protein
MGTGLKSKGRSAGPSGLSLLLLALSAALVYAKDPDPQALGVGDQGLRRGRRQGHASGQGQPLCRQLQHRRLAEPCRRFSGSRGHQPRLWRLTHFSDLNHYVKELVLKYQPAQIFVYEGDNDINAGKTPARVAEDFATFVKVVHKALPKTKITFISIKPSKSRWKLWPKMREANEQIKRSCKGHDWLRVVDVGSAMLNERGEPKDEIFVEDGLHMNKAGYKIWAEQIRPLLLKKP